MMIWLSYVNTMRKTLLEFLVAEAVQFVLYVSMQQAGAIVVYLCDC
jgi:hypothetical protein